MIWTRIRLRQRVLLGILAVVLMGGLLSAPARAQFIEQGLKLQSSNLTSDSRQGHSVVLSADGDTAIVGGPTDHPAGAVLVYTRSAGVWVQDFHALSVPGQMIVTEVPVVFCFTVNWNGPAEDVPGVTAAYQASLTKILAGVANIVKSS